MARASSRDVVAQVRRMVEIARECHAGAAMLTEPQRRVALAGYDHILKNLSPQTAAAIEREVLQAEEEGIVPDETGRVYDYATCFWEKVRKEKLPYVPRDRIRELLKQGRLRERADHELAVDMMMSHRLSGKERARLSELIGDYEARGD